MHEPQPPTSGAANDLALDAFLFACGGMEDRTAAAFAERLAGDQSAREALSQVVYLAGSLAGGAPVRPDPAYRTAVRERLCHAEQATSTPGPKRGYPGHPLLWVALGAAAMVVLYAGLASWSPPRHDVPVLVRETPPTARLVASDGERPAAATVWAELHTPSRLARVHGEQDRRRCRSDDLHRCLNHDERRFRLLAHPAGKP
jgi:hypothetical protein